MVAANKQALDDSSHMEPDELLEQLDLDQTFNRTVGFITCSCKLGAGVVNIISFIGGAIPTEF